MFFEVFAFLALVSKTEGFELSEESKEIFSSIVWFPCLLAFLGIVPEFSVLILNTADGRLLTESLIVSEDLVSC